MSELTIGDAYREACLALGEEVVERRLTAKAASTRIAELESELAVKDAAPDRSDAAHLNLPGAGRR